MGRIGCGEGVDVGLGVDVGFGVFVGVGVLDGSGVAVGVDVGEGEGVNVNVGLGVFVGTDVSVGAWGVRSSPLIGVIVGTGAFRICPISLLPFGCPSDLKTSAIKDKFSEPKESAKRSIP
jgi:hypothetical protein